MGLSISSNAALVSDSLILFYAVPTDWHAVLLAIIVTITHTALVVLIGLIAGGVWFLARRLKRPAWQTHLVYLLTDALLTGLIFGANL